jgi:hypothetical protein
VVELFLRLTFKLSEATSAPVTIERSPERLESTSTFVAEDMAVLTKTKTLSPRAKNCFVSSRPMPDDAPVTQTVKGDDIWKIRK